jgi:hypothetical protein
VAVLLVPTLGAPAGVVAVAGVAEAIPVVAVGGALQAGRWGAGAAGTVSEQGDGRGAG